MTLTRLAFTLASLALAAAAPWAGPAALRAEPVQGSRQAPAPQPPATPAGQPPRHVIMISIDGLMPSTYTKPGPSKVPTLRRLAQEGAWAEGVVGVLPTVTYPSHTTMITGVLPAVHGIYANSILDPEGLSNGEWYRYARDIKVSTLPGVVKGRGLTTAAVSWPVSIGMEVDFLLPEAGYHYHPKMIELMRAISQPRHLIDAFETAQGKPLPWPMTDDHRTALAAWIFRTHRPNLTLLHIFGTDSAQHTFGPGSPEALDAIEKADAHVKQMLDVVAEANLQSQTDVVIVSDHGFWRRSSSCS
jgi:predicted AlkP superfamily pyrophosphatase or phosphodiesterase